MSSIVASHARPRRHSVIINEMSTQTGTALGDGVVREDIPCHRCRYNLRGLTPPGDCPECGWDLRDSINEYRRHGELLAPPDPAWARQIRDGAWLAVVAAVVVAAVVVAPGELYRMPFRDAPLHRTLGRVGLLSAMCIGWVLGWASVWKLTALEGRRRDRVLVATAARVLCTAYLLIPLAWVAATWAHHHPAGARREVLMALQWAGLAGMALLMLRVVQLLNRRRAFFAAVSAFVVAIAIPCTAFFISLGHIGSVEPDPSSLGMMLRVCTFPIGIPEFTVLAWWVLIRGRLDLPVAYLAIAPAWTVLLAAYLIWLYRPARRA